MLQQAFTTKMISCIRATKLFFANQARDVHTRLLIMLVALALGGCATMAKPGSMLYQSAQEKKLTQAVALLEQGKTAAATELLSVLCDEPGVPRITDEALFRLSLLRLGAGQEKSALRQVHHDLERLKKEFPASSWAPLAAILNEYLISADDLQHQNRKLKEQNLSSTRENKELRQSIEKLKNLELELGNKIRR